MEQPDLTHTATERRIGRDFQGGATRGHTSARESVPDLVPAVPMEVLFHTGRTTGALMGAVILAVRIARHMAMATPRWDTFQRR